jgi:hypothetical protein
MADHLNRRIAKLEEKVGHLERSSAPREQNETSPIHQDEARKEHQGAEPVAPLGAKVRPTPKKADRSDDKWNKTIPGRIWRFIWQFKTLEGIGIIAAVVYAALTYRQWADLRHNFEVEQRAWIKVDFEAPKKDSTEAYWIMRVKNIGKSVALTSTVIETEGEIVDSKRAPSFIPQGLLTRACHGSTKTALLFPTDELKHEACFYPDRSTLTESDLQGLARGDFYLAVWGHVAYRDQFGEHWTQFCNWTDKGSPQASNKTFASAACVSFNSVGDGPYRKH